MDDKKDLPVPRVQIRRFIGKNGGFASNERIMYICELVGVNGHVRAADQNNLWGHATDEYPKRDAKYWCELTGWPLARVFNEYQTIVTLNVES